MAQVLHGDAGGNKIFTTANKTQAYGLADNDTLVGEGNIDVILIGGSGNDNVIIKDGTGTLSGGADNDTIDSSGSDVTLNAGTGDDSIRLSNDAELVYFQYDSGDGNDYIHRL